MVENVKNWVWVIYEPPKDVNSYGHFFPVTAISRLLSQGKNKGERFYCPMCLSPFRSERTFSDHMNHCKIHGNQRIEMPAEGKDTLQFKNFQNSLLQVDKVSLDCETRLVEVSDPSRPNIVKEHKLVACS
jgi:uncharacterized C2H2 Zn-finger protein